MGRADQLKIRDAIVLSGCVIPFAVLAIILKPSWWSVPFWLAHGLLCGSVMDSRWHMRSRVTACKTRWVNKVVYHIDSLCMIRDPHCWMFGHAPHHSNLIGEGRDTELEHELP